MTPWAYGPQAADSSSSFAAKTPFGVLAGMGEDLDQARGERGQQAEQANKGKKAAEDAKAKQPAKGGKEKGAGAAGAGPSTAPAKPAPMESSGHWSIRFTEKMPPSQVAAALLDAMNAAAPREEVDYMAQ